MLQTSRVDMDEDIFSIVYEDSITPLMRAVKDRNLKKMKRLLASGSLPQTPDNRGWTAIHYSVATNQFEALKLLLKRKAQKNYLVNLTTWDNVTPLLLALKRTKPSVRMVKLLLNAGACTKMYTFTSLSPLHLACLNKGNLSVVKLLIENGADPNVQEEYSLFTPLHFAVTHSSDVKMIKYLLKVSDLSIKNVYNRTAFLEACNLRFTSAVKEFLKKNKNLANINLGIPPLVYAAFWGDIKMVKVLIQAGADPNDFCKALVPSEGKLCPTLLDSESYLPIHSALTNLEVFKFLLDLTNPVVIKDLTMHHTSFPVHVLTYGTTVSFYEALLQSNAPLILKKANCRAIINHIIGSSKVRDTLIKRFTWFFRYNFHLDPDDVLHNFVFLMTEEELVHNYYFLYILALMGISSSDEYSNKSVVVHALKTAMHNFEGTSKGIIMKKTCELLRDPVLSLKKLCRIILRRSIWYWVENNWKAFRMIKDCDYLPEILKDFLCYDVL